MLNSDTLLWYKKPATDFDSAMPIGNGRIGGMVYGEVEYEKIHINEDSVWSGGKRNRNNPNSLENLPKIRELLFEEKIQEAQKLSFETMAGVTPNCRHYMPLCDLFINQENVSEYDNYKRGLDLNTAIAFTNFSANGVNYTREAFVSYPNQVMIIKISADKPSSISVSARLDGRDDYYDDNRPYNSDTLLFTGGTGSSDGIFFAATLSGVAKNGKVSTVGGSLVVKNADEVTFILGSATSYRHENYVKTALDDVERAKEITNLKANHIKDYKSLFNRASICLSNNFENTLLPTDERLNKLKESHGKYIDNSLIELYFNFGRYLMISASRLNTLPMNLQGIWNKDMWPAWGSRFTININTEMNYWIAENCNLSECHIPLFDHIERMRPNGRETARDMYNCSGFVCHHNTDIWGDTAPQDLWHPATIWPMGAAWLCLHIFEHYEYTQDKVFLKEKYETLKECAEFFIDFLIEDKKGRLVTCPSVSPENTYLTETGTKGSLCIAPSMDTEIITVLFNDIIKSDEILGNNDIEFTDKLKAILKRLPKLEIGKYGQIKEWAEDYDEVEIGHRHISQLFALHPADLISLHKTPELAAASRATLNRRLSHGGGHTGWSRAWIINMWARLGENQKVLENIQMLLAHSTNLNLFDSHPPFQIDGNFGGTSGITEALLQSHSNEIALLPALPSEWSNGAFSGLKAKGGFEISATWKSSKLISAEIISLSGNECNVRTKENVTVTMQNGTPIKTHFLNGVISFQTNSDVTYIIKSI